MLNLRELLLHRLHRKESINRYKHCQRKTIDFSRIHYFLILVEDLHTTTNKDIPNGQLMHLALEVVHKVVESNHLNDQSRELTSDHQDISLPPVCAL